MEEIGILEVGGFQIGTGAGYGGPRPGIIRTAVRHLRTDRRGYPRRRARLRVRHRCSIRVRHRPAFMRWCSRVVRRLHWTRQAVSCAIWKSETLVLTWA